MSELPTMMACNYGTATGVSRFDNLMAVRNPAYNDIGVLKQYDSPTKTQTVIIPSTKEPHVAQSKRRLVRVLVVDPSDSVPVDRCLLHAGGEQFTDSTDQELFFDIDIRSILEKHNEYRVTLDDKSSKAETPKKLEPARIRDLKMVVVTLAEF